MTHGKSQFGWKQQSQHHKKHLILAYFKLFIAELMSICCQIILLTKYQSQIVGKKSKKSVESSNSSKLVTQSSQQQWPVLLECF